MTLQEILDATELNRNSFNTLDRRTGLPFMKRDVHPEGGRDRYFAAHAVALGCMLDLQAAGVPAAKAATAVDAVFHRITRTVEMIGAGEAPGWSLIHVVDFEDGTWGFAYGDPAATTLRGEGADEFKARVTVNAISVLKRLHARANAKAEIVA